MMYQLHISCHGTTARIGPRPPHYGGFMIKPRYNTLGRTLLDVDQPDTETSTWQRTTLTKDRYPCPRRDSNSQSQ
jgi:hypothetical protein